MKTMNRLPFPKAALAAGLLIASGASSAADLESMEATLRTLQAQVANLQAQLAEQKAAVAKVSQEHAAHGPDAHANHDAHGHGDWTKGISISGVVEAEMVHTDNAGSTADTEDFKLATFEMEIHSHLTEFAEAEVVLKYEDGSPDDDQLSIDEAVLTFTPAFMGPASFTIGKAGVPLAAFETLAASDPYTKDLGDLGGQRIAQLGFALDSGLYGSATAYRVENTGTASNADGGFELGYAVENENFSVDVAAAYVNDASAIGVGTKESTNLRATVASGPFTVIGEYLKADSSTVGNADTKATNLELGYGFRMADMDNTFAVAWRKLDDASGNVTTNVTEKKAKVAALTLGVAENAAVVLEYKDEDQSGTEGVDNDVATAKFVYEF
jgi:outer membrane murein-binding lipoprotein Lpp